MAGVINIITRPGDGPPRVQGFAEGGSFGTWQTGGSLSGGVGNFRGRVAGSHLDSSGSNISRAGGEDDGYQNDTIAFNTEYDLIPEATLSVTGRHTESESEYDNVDFLTGLPGDSDSVTEASQDYGRAGLDLALLDGRWQHRLGGSVNATENDNFQSGFEESSTQGRKYKFDYQSSFALDAAPVDNARHVLTGVVEQEWEDYTQRGIASPFGDPNVDFETDTLGIAGEYRARLTEDLSAAASVRYDDNADFDDSVTYRVAASYRVAATGMTLHAAYGEGVKNPGFSERFGFYTSESFPFVGNPDLQPEESRGFEVGAAQQLFDQRLRLALTWFDENLHDEINGFVFDPVLFVFTAQNVDGKSHRSGLEFDAEWQLARNLRVAAAYTYIDATEPDPAGGQQRELRRPEHGGSLNVNYTAFDDRLNLNADLFVSGEQDDLFFPPVPPFLSERVALSDYALLSLAASWRWSDTLTVYGRVENALDDNHEEVLGFTAPGAAAYAGIRVGFGQ
jgi:vitamin B12 transporter